MLRSESEMPCTSSTGLRSGTGCGGGLAEPSKKDNVAPIQAVRNMDGYIPKNRRADKSVKSMRVSIASMVFNARLKLTAWFGRELCCDLICEHDGRLFPFHLHDQVGNETLIGL